MSTVLVVDDDAALVRMVSLTLRDDGFAVSTAANGAEALDAAVHTEPDVILLDLEMPVMDGRTCFRELREQGIDAPVVVVSGERARVAREELGADAALDKPFTPAALIASVRRLI